MPNQRAKSAFLSLLLALFPTAIASAQSTTVDYDDDKLSTPTVAFPIYNVALSACRWQSFVPSSFSNLPKTAMYVSRIGFQLSGTETYKTFVLRAGAGKFTALDPKWTTNLPDQRIQKDLSGVEIRGGQPNNGARQNAWVEFELNYPFVWTPGENVVVDLTTNVAANGRFLYAGAGSTAIPRVLDFGYTGGTTGTVQVSGGLKIRLVFEPITNVIPFGTACKGYQGQAPRLGSFGAPKIGNSALLLTLNNASPNANDALLLGITKNKVPFELGGGCNFYTSADVLLFGRTDTNGADGRTFDLRVSNTLAGLTVHCQWAVVDSAAASITGWTLSNGGSIVLYN